MLSYHILYTEKLYVKPGASPGPEFERAPKRETWKVIQT